jgi:hypothetical protein
MVFVGKVESIQLYRVQNHATCFRSCVRRQCVLHSSWFMIIVVLSSISSSISVEALLPHISLNPPRRLRLIATQTLPRRP